MPRSNKGSKVRPEWKLDPDAWLGGPDGSRVFQAVLGKRYRQDSIHSGLTVPKESWDDTFGKQTSWVEVFAPNGAKLWTCDWTKAIAWADKVEVFFERPHYLLPYHLFDVYEKLDKGKGRRWYKKRVVLADRPCFCFRLDCPDVPRRGRWIDERNGGVVPVGEQWRRRVRAQSLASGMANAPASGTVGGESPKRLADVAETLERLELLT